MGAALGRLKARLGQRRDFETPTTLSLTKLAKPTLHAYRPEVTQPEVSSVSSVSVGVVGVSKTQSAPEEAFGRSRGRVESGAEGQGRDFENTYYPATDRTDKTLSPKRLLANQLNSQQRFNEAYAAEFAPGPDTPGGPCQCGDTVFHKLAARSPWRCRSCEPPSARLAVRWFVLPREWPR